MGKNSKARRDARARAARAGRQHRERAATTGDPTADAFGFTSSPRRAQPPPPPPDASEAWEMWVAARRNGLGVPRDVLARLGDHRERADRGAETALLRHLHQAWTNGWQPREIRREVRRTTSARAARLVEIAIHVDHARRPDQSLDPRWAAQVHDLGQREVSTHGAWLAAWREREGLGHEPAVACLLDALGVVMFAPVLDELIPPPGVSGDTSRARLGDLGAAGADSDPMLDRIRKLLAKAESTEFEAEAAALSGKAQELMTRYAIDLAAVSAPEDDQSPRMIRLPVDAPYADAKSYLLQVVAGANRSRSVFYPYVAMSSVIGHAGDLVGVELLFTSLLVQAQSAMSAPTGGSRPGARSRSQSYRSAFLLAFANRIGERLEGANDQVFSDSGANAQEYLPVLRARELAIDDFITERYGELSSGRVRGGHDPAGWAQGRAAGDQARLDSGQLDP